jgi:hypothetical protein
MLIATLLLATTLGTPHRPPVPVHAVHVARRTASALAMDAEIRDYMRGHAGALGAVTSSMRASTLALAMARGVTLKSMPMFARKYNVACSFCHTTIPRLNGTGYKFRAAGFRMPEDIGKESTKKFEFGNVFSARVQARFDVQATNQPNGAPVANVVAGVPGKRIMTIAPSFQEATIYPLTGSFGKYFGALSELSVSPEDFFEVENAYLRVVVGNENTFFTSRIGIFHPWEGFGASDRPLSNARTLFQTSGLSAGGRAVPYVYQPWGLDEVGTEVGGEFGALSLRAAILGGTFMRWEEGANAFIPFPSQTGPWKGANQAVPGLGKPYSYVSHNTPDFSANITYMLQENGGALSLLYYRGNIATPTQCTNGTAIGKKDASGVVCGVTGASAGAPFGEAGNTDFDFTDATAFRNNFDRVGAYASYPIGKSFLPAVGYNYGKDHNADGTTFNSNGAFVEGSYAVSKYATAGARYDMFHPNTSVNNKQWAFTPYLNIPLQNGLQIITEYQRRDFQLAPSGATHRHNDTFQVRMIFIQ